MSKLVTIRSYAHETPAMLDKMRLEGSGIFVVVQTDDCGGVNTFLQMLTGVQVKVRAEDVEKAEAILAFPDAGE